MYVWLRGLRSWASGGGCGLNVARALEVADVGLEFVDDAEIFVVTDDVRVGLVEAATEAGGTEIAGVQIAEMDPGEVERKGDREERHGGRHREAGLQDRIQGWAEGGGNAAAKGQNLAGIGGKGRGSKRLRRRGAAE